MNRLCMLACIGVLACAPASAAERGFYVGVDLGQSSYDLDRNSIDRQIVGALEEAGLAVIDGRSETSEDGFTYGVIVGYQVWPFLALEAAYVDLDDAEYKSSAVVSDGSTAIDLDARLEASSSGPALSVLGILPVWSGWEVYARAGVYFSSNDARARLSSADLSDTLRDSSHTEEFLWGAGLGYTRDGWTVRLDFQQFTDVGDSSTFGDVNVDRITLGAVYRY